MFVLLPLVIKLYFLRIKDGATKKKVLLFFSKNESCSKKVLGGDKLRPTAAKFGVPVMSLHDHVKRHGTGYHPRLELCALTSENNSIETVQSDLPNQITPNHDNPTPSTSRAAANVEEGCCNSEFTAHYGTTETDVQNQTTSNSIDINLNVTTLRMADKEISFSQLTPLPKKKLAKGKGEGKGRKKQHSEILTSTPMKSVLEYKAVKKTEKWRNLQKDKEKSHSKKKQII